MVVVDRELEGRRSLRDILLQGEESPGSTGQDAG